MESRIKSSEPPETDLDYYARPENYTGSNLSTLTKFLAAKEKEEPKSRKKSKKKKNRSEERNLFRRYKHILPADSQDDFSSSSSSSPSSSSDESDNNAANKNAAPKDSNNYHRLRKQRSRKDKHHINQQLDAGQTTRENRLLQETVRFSDVAEEKTDPIESLSESGYESRVRSENDQFQETKQNAFYDSEHEESLDSREARGPVTTTTLTSITITTTSSDIITSSSSNTSSQSTSRSSVTAIVQNPEAKKPGLAKFISVRNKLTGLTKEAKRRVLRA